MWWSSCVVSRQYTLYYYLVDGTAEIKEVAEPGHVHFPNLLKRQKLPKVGRRQGRGSVGGGAGTARQAGSQTETHDSQGPRYSQPTR